MADGAASWTTLASRFSNAAGRAIPSSEGRGTRAAPIRLAPRNPSRNARPVGTQMRTRSPRRMPLRVSAAAQFPAPRTHSRSVTTSSRNALRLAVRNTCTAMRSGSRAAWARIRVAIGSDIGDEPLYQTAPQPPPELAGGEAAALQLVRDQCPVSVQHPKPFQPLQGVPPHLPDRQAQLTPHRLSQERGDARANALEDQVLRLGVQPPAQGVCERLAQLLAVGQVSRLVLEVAAEHGREQRLARLGQERRYQRRGGPFEDHLADQELHLG